MSVPRLAESRDSAGCRYAISTTGPRSIFFPYDGGIQCITANTTYYATQHGFKESNREGILAARVRITEITCRRYRVCPPHIFTLEV